jgi:hypothetical protein
MKFGNAALIRDSFAQLAANREPVRRLIDKPQRTAHSFRVVVAE